MFTLCFIGGAIATTLGIVLACDDGKNHSDDLSQYESDHPYSSWEESHPYDP